jgi:hypothetical protein
MADGLAFLAGQGPAEGELPQPVEAQPQEIRQPSPTLETCKRMLDEFRDLTTDARKLSEKCDDYYHGDQWTLAERRALAKRKQPDTTVNRIRVAVNGTVGVIERGKSEPRAYPRTPKDEESADVATDVLRYISDRSRFHYLKTLAFRDMLVPGTMAAIVEVDEDLQVDINTIRWEEFVYDPRSRREDFQDARYRGIAKWRYANDVAAEYPDRRTEIEGAFEGSGMVDSSMQDRPTSAGFAGWVDKKNRRILFVELYSREQEGWVRTCFHFGGVLAQGLSPYLDDKGKPCCPIEAQSAYVDKDNKRSGAVKDMLSIQDEVNKRRSKLLHLVSTSQIHAVDPSAQAVDSNEARAEAARPDGVIPFGWQKVPTTDMATGQIQLLQEAKNEIERMGPNPAVLGRQGADSSGRAVLARQQAGLVEQAILYGALEDWELRIYRQCWARAKQYWTAPMYIRVTDDLEAPKFVGLNQEPGPPAPDPANPEQQIVHPETQQPGFIQTMDDRTGEPLEAPQMVFGLKNSLAEMDVDITLDTTPSVANLQEEQFKDLVQLMSANPAYAAQVPFKTVMKLSAIPHKRQILDEIEQASQASAQQQQQTQQQQIQLAVETAMAKIENTRANTAKTVAQTEQIGVDTQVTHAEAAINAFQAGHDLETQLAGSEQELAHPAAGVTGDTAAPPQ